MSTNYKAIKTFSAACKALKLNASELAKLLSGISGGSIAPATPARQPKKDKEEILKEGNITDTPGEEVKNPVTLEMLREKTAEKSQANKKDAIKK